MHACRKAGRNSSGTKQGRRCCVHGAQYCNPVNTSRWRGFTASTVYTPCLCFRRSGLYVGPAPTHQQERQTLQSCARHRSQQSPQRQCRTGGHQRRQKPSQMRTTPLWPQAHSADISVNQSEHARLDTNTSRTTERTSGALEAPAVGLYGRVGCTAGGCEPLARRYDAPMQGFRVHATGVGSAQCTTTGYTQVVRKEA